MQEAETDETVGETGSGWPPPMDPPPQADNAARTKAATAACGRRVVESLLLTRMGLRDTQCGAEAKGHQKAQMRVDLQQVLEGLSPRGGKICFVPAYITSYSYFVFSSVPKM